MRSRAPRSTVTTFVPAAGCTAAARATAGKPAGEGGPTAIPLTADQAKRLQDLLAKAQMGKLSPEEARQLADAAKLLSKLDAKADPRVRAGGGPMSWETSTAGSTSSTGSSARSTRKWRAARRVRCSSRSSAT